MASPSLSSDSLCAGNCLCSGNWYMATVLRQFSWAAAANKSGDTPVPSTMDSKGRGRATVAIGPDDLAEAFLYASSSEELWNELEERFGQSNGPLIYQIEKKIADLQQNNDSVGAYFTKLKKLWDEMATVNEPPTCQCGGCTCDAKRKANEADQKRKLVKFLMGLNDGFDVVRGQILLLEPFPSVSKACSLVQQVERQKTITGAHTIGAEMAAYVNGNDIDGQSSAMYAGKTNNQRQPFFSKPDPRKNKGICTYCKGIGHVKEQCFKLIGYPDWFKGNKGKKGQSSYGGNKFAGNAMLQSQSDCMETPLEVLDAEDEGHSFQANSALVKNLAQEVMKMMNERGNSKQSDTHSLNTYAHFAGKHKSMASTVLNLNDAAACCVDMGSRSDGLYKLKVNHSPQVDLDAHVLAAKSCKFELLHARLGHSSLSKMKHISEYSELPLPVPSSMDCDYSPILEGNTDTNPTLMPLENQNIHTLEAENTSGSNVCPDQSLENRRHSTRTRQQPTWMKDYIFPKRGEQSSNISSQPYSFHAGTKGMITVLPNYHSTAFQASLKKAIVAMDNDVDLGSKVNKL
ncbi:unnamed protein product [Cuscuta campestris]|uniref:Retrotransposon gag domain-containing protein n=1 Tax=Cuscuta campestris TaxID=132261 RepID=A0A484LLG8_9ASTE|nr:unnamed protein product [Cuscuta campestris]